MCAPYPSWPELLGTDQRGGLLTCNDHAVSCLSSGSAVWAKLLEKEGDSAEEASARTQEVQAENVTVAEGGQAEINCKLHQYDGSIVVIQNPSRQTLFFNGTRALKDERFQLVEFTQKQVRIVLSNARLEDEGGYYCQLYTEDTHHQIAILTVLVPPDSPLVEVKEQAGRRRRS
ncbi:cell adhesion molecule 4 [Crotalus adamanteus]|uniref:Cell adhesion molecule 4 n=1 Tax=Crotalus adamanteus TaxID=8729 RepID=A0AAW1AY67_CROAD